MKMSALLLVILAVGCSRTESASPSAQSSPPPDATLGKALVNQYGCTMCHAIPGSAGPQGVLAPSLEGVASRPTLSLGVVQNTPENMARFIENPPAVNPQSAMPAAGVTAADARAIAAFLSTLK